MVLVIPKSGLSPHMTIGQSALDSDTPEKFLELDVLSEVPSPPRGRVYYKIKQQLWSETLPFSY